MATVATLPIRKRGSMCRNLIINAVLLSLIDPVRGKPTRDSLDENPEDYTTTNIQLKQKFLDSFALICSTSGSGKETASAVCMEQHDASGTVLRVARNRGLTPHDTAKLERVIEILVAVATGKKPPSKAENDLLHVVVDLDQDRIASLAQKLEKRGIGQLIQQATTNSYQNDHDEKLEATSFRQWVRTCPFVGTYSMTAGSSPSPACVLWASEARWKYDRHFQALLTVDPKPPPTWLETLHKLARYWASVKSMVKFAIKEPDAFAGLCIKVVQAPKQQTFSLQHERNIAATAVQRLTKGDHQNMMERLSRRLGTDDVEAKVRRSCTLKLTLHAEMQLLEFYDLNRAKAPRLRMMGTSKKACYLCHEYLLRHPLGIRVSACHEKVYPTWMPPTSRDPPGVPGKQPFWAFVQHIERATTKALKTELDGDRRPKNRDSTAGPSLTATATARTGTVPFHLARSVYSVARS
ncbi:hypothetical protein Micbo1qcDRAFT_154089 [Microdochium bolleyi]|uniref:Uncharacterized protein n=1 Tax=Microdochium bolleyi TaxID=196109 RepID=A0A136IKT4_9PEZI|nr:hypothetical protein Micbo1qcDRAFT_154089 [Microdochium bolleyi]